MKLLVACLFVLGISQAEAYEPGTVLGPTSSTVGGLALWLNATGTQLKDGAGRLDIPFTPYNAFPYGWGNTAVGTCVLVNIDPARPSFTGTQCGIMGGVATDPAAGAKYDIGDTVAFGNFMYSTVPWFQNVSGTFSGANFIPTTALTPAQVAKLRQYEILDTNDVPPCSGTIQSFAANGTSVTTSGWYQQGPSGGVPSPSACTPTGTQATVRFSKIYGQNLYVARTSGDQQTNSVGLELDIINNTGINQTCYSYDSGGCGGGHTGPGGTVVPSDVGLDIVGLGSYRATAGLQVRSYGGGFNAGAIISGLGIYGVIVEPHPAGQMSYGFYSNVAHIGFAAVPTSDGEAWRNWNNAGTNGQIKGRMLYNGDMHWGLENEGGTGAATHSQFFYSSAHANPDTTVQYAGGTGANDGSMAMVTGNLYEYGLLHLLKNSGVSGAPGATWVALRVEPGTSAGTCKLVAYAGTSAFGTTVVDNVGAGC